MFPMVSRLRRLCPVTSIYRPSHIGANAADGKIGFLFKVTAYSDAILRHRHLVIIASCNGFLHDGIKPLPGPTFTDNT